MKLGQRLGAVQIEKVKEDLNTFQVKEARPVDIDN